MSIKVILVSRNGNYDAKGFYLDGKLTIQRGSKINEKSNSRFERAGVVNSYRNDSEYVSDDLVLKKDIEFSSPSTAAQFVTDNVSNGYISWKTPEGITLKNYLSKAKSKNENSRY